MRTSSITKRSAVSTPLPPTAHRQAGFTLLELLIVIALIMVLAGLMIPAFNKVKRGANQRKAQIETKVIGAAIQAYKLQEKKFPVDNPVGVASDVTFGGVGGSNSEVMDNLKAASPPVLDVNKLRWENANGTGSAIDPYDNPYKITLDLNYDGKIGNNFKEYTVE